jgi:hypothetical protein
VPQPGRRRWSRFSLRALFVVVTAVCIWLGYHLNWIRQRHACLAEQEAAAANSVNIPRTVGEAPLPLRLLGEGGIARLPLYVVVDKSKNQDRDTILPEAIHSASRLFPESRLLVVLHTRPDDRIQLITIKK